MRLAPTQQPETIPSDVLLTAADITRVTAVLCGAATLLRTVQRDFARLRRRGVPVVRLPRCGRGQPPWAVPLDAWCASRGLDADEVRRVLGRESLPVAQAA